MVDFYQLSGQEVLKALGSSETGLSEGEVQKRLKQYGPNELGKERGFRVLKFLLAQFKSPLVYILLIAAALSFWIREFFDTVIILAAVLVNIGIGFYQEYSSSQILKKLTQRVRVTALVKRDGELREVDSSELVPGDIISLKSGMKVPADARILFSKELFTNEALLTGESSAVKKESEKIIGEKPLADRKNMVFMGTAAEKGEALAAVVKTGSTSEIGQLALLTKESKEDRTPLQERISNLGKLLSGLVVFAALVIVVFGLLEAFDFYQIFVTAVAVAVAAIPEGLPAAMAVVLALASKNISKNEGLVRKLLAAETLGSVSVLLADKTGTLTEGRMKVEKIISKNPERVLLANALANEAILGKEGVRGEATDRAKLEAFLEKGFDLKKTLEVLPRINFLPFDSARRFLASFHAGRVFVSGAPEVVLELSRDFPEREELSLEFEELAKKGFRVIAAAEADLPLAPEEVSGKGETELQRLVKNLTFLGLAVIRDPIRKEVIQTIREAREAGIKTVMFTGDHRLTALEVGEELGLKTAGQNVMDGVELDKISDEELKEKVGEIEIFARVDPKHKMRIVKAWKERGEAVAVTGDGINDAPALKLADIGIALNSGTDVTKEAADLVLVENSLTTIAKSIRYGRAALDNIRKITVFLLSGSFSEIILILGALLMRIPLPLTAAQILWMNLIEDGLPNFALAFESADQDIMKRKPLKRSEPILDKKGRALAFAFGIVTDIILLLVFVLFLKFSTLSLEYLRTFIFAALGTDSLMYVFSLKSLDKPIFKADLWSNRYLLVAVGLGFLMMGLAVYLPGLSVFLKTTPLALPHVILIFVLGIFKISILESIKWFYNRKAV